MKQNDYRIAVADTQVVVDMDYCKEEVDTALSETVKAVNNAVAVVASQQSHYLVQS